MSTPLLATKLYIPPLRPQLIPRSHLIEQLNKSLQTNCRLTLISAPPGFGKTTLLSEWLHQTNDELGTMNDESSSRLIHHSRVAWLSLDEGDNDPVRFWSYVIAALDRVEAGLGAEAMALLHAAQAPSLETILTVLINAVADLSARLILILDDYHVIEAELIHQALTFLLDHLPPQMYIVLTSRVDPPLPLTRLRVRGQLTELRDSDLRFSLNESVTFFNHAMKLNLSLNDIMALENQTEGWIAGLQLAALSMQGHADAAGFVQAFTGSHRYVFNYLAEEVLTRQSGQIQTFLLYTSILDRLYGSLCDAVLGQGVEAQGSSGENFVIPVFIPPGASASSQELLEYLEQANLFLVPLDDQRRWYRYHHLFTDFLRAQLRQNISEDALKTLHLRASHWYAANDFTAEAIGHALAAGAAEQAAKLIEQVIIARLTRGEVTTVVDWLALLPDVMIHTRPRLTLGQAWVMVITNQWDQLEPLLQKAEKTLLAQKSTAQSHDAVVQGFWGEIAAMRAMLMDHQGNSVQSIELSLQALERLPQDNLIVRSIITMNLGLAYRFSGNLNLAAQHLTEAAEMARRIDNLIIALASINNLAQIMEERGNLAQAIELFRQGLELAEQKTGKRGRPAPLAKWSYLGLAEVLREQNELEAAKRQLTIALDLEAPESLLVGAIPVAYLILARILQVEGDEAGAGEAIQQARRATPGTWPTSPWIDAIQARLWLAQGNLARAEAWAQSCNLPLDEEFNYDLYPGEYAALVRIFIAQEQFTKALALLQRMEAAAKMAGRSGRLIEILMLQALAWYGQGDPDQALPPLIRALSLGEQGGYVRTFADEGTHIVPLLHLTKSRRLASEVYIDKLLAALGAEEQESKRATREMLGSPTPLLVEPLSERELEVLRLVAAGLSNQEIAEKLVIAEGTVKKHLHNVFGKLNARSRTQALLRAAELDLL